MQMRLHLHRHCDSRLDLCRGSYRTNVDWIQMALRHIGSSIFFTSIEMAPDA